MTPAEMEENVARAVAKIDYSHEVMQGYLDHNTYREEHYIDDNWSGRLEYARVAINAVREALETPTPVMRHAGDSVGDYPWDGMKSDRVFRAMLSASPIGGGDG